MQKLINDNSFIATLVNGPCKITGFDDEPIDIPVNPEWIDDAASEEVTAIYRTLLPAGNPYQTFVKVVRDPETERDGTVVADQIHRTRYIIVNILPECSFPYDWNYGFLHAMSIFSLSGWELSRAAMDASRLWMKIRIEKEPNEMILNNARIQWVSIYVGKKEWRGTIKLSQHKGLSIDEELELDTHFVNAREIAEATGDPLMKRLLEAVDNSDPVITDDSSPSSTQEKAEDNPEDKPETQPE